MNKVHQKLNSLNTFVAHTQKSAGAMPLFFTKNCQKVVSKLLIVTSLTFNIPWLSTMSVARADDIPANQWVTITPKADPMMTGLTIPTDAYTKGMWSNVKNWPIIAVHSAVLPDGRVLTFGTDTTIPAAGSTANADTRYFDVWDPTIGFGTDSHNTNFRAQQQNSFCSTSSYLSSGDLLISGGGLTTKSTDPNNTESMGSTIFSPSANSTTDVVSKMAIDRWYATMLNLPDGRQIILGGLDVLDENIELDSTTVNNSSQPDSNGNASGRVSLTPEIFENNAWRSLLGATSTEAFGAQFLRASYPHAWIAPNGKVFGISADKMWTLDPNANNNLGSITTLGNFKTGYDNNCYGCGKVPVNVGTTSSAVMYAPGKVIQVGGNGGQVAISLAASNMATVVDLTFALNSDPSALIEQDPMTNARRFSNTLVLPNGKVLVTGGSKNGTDNDNQYGNFAVYAAEIWTPNNSTNKGTWAVGADATIFRGYHSTSALLTNGTVLSAGGGASSASPVQNFNAEIYYPPYLFTNAGGLAVRPVISAISGLAYNNDAQIQLDVGANDTITDMAFIGLSTVTHSFNNGQRRIPVSFTRSGNRLTATVPNANLTPPGYYQVVVVNSNGVPSLGTIVAVGAGMTAPDGSTTAPGGNVKPTVSLTAPVANASYGKGANVSLTAYAADTDGAITKVEFYDGTKLIDTDTSDPYIATLTNATPGKHNLTAKAYDDANAVTSSSIVSINVSTKVNTPPKVKLTTPKNNANYVQGYVIPISATASDTGGSISKVEFYDGATLINTDTTKPYSYALPVDTATGQHSLTAKAYDNTDLVTTSNTITINVNANQAPIVTLTNLGISYVQGTKVTLKATAKDLDKGTKISRVEFYDDTTIIGTDTKAPYTAIFNTGILNTLGDHPITAKAYDNATPNAVSTSAIAVVKVTLPKPSIAKLCAKQNKICTIPEGTTATVWYGAKSSWYNKPNVTGQLTCDATSFDGEPITGNKTCVFVGN